MKPKIVIKVGGGQVVQEGHVRQDWLDTLFLDMKDLSSTHEVCLVASGAMRAGCAAFQSSFLTKDQKRASAALGQMHLDQAFLKAGEASGLRPGLMLIDVQDVLGEKGAQCAETLRAIWGAGGVPVLNQNDALVTPDTEFRDNDHLAACLVHLIKADLMVYLTGTDGVYRHFGTQDAQHVPLLNSHDDIISHAWASTDALSGGGMAGKLEAAFQAAQTASEVVILDGRGTHPLGDLLSNREKGTRIRV